MRDLSTALKRSQQPVRRYQRAQVLAVVSANLLTVRLDDSAETLTIPALSASPTYAVDNVVMVARDATGPLVVGRLGAGASWPGPTLPPVPPPGTLRQRTLTILPSSTGTYRGGWRPGDELQQGDLTGSGVNLGAAFYGGQLVGLGASLTSARSGVLTYRRQPGGSLAAQAPTVRTLAQRERPAGAPTLLSSAVAAAVAVDREQSWELPAGLLDELLDGTAGGLGIYVAVATPYIVLAGPTGFGSSMSLSLTFYA